MYVYAFMYQVFGCSLHDCPGVAVRGVLQHGAQSALLLPHEEHRLGFQSNLLDVDDVGNSPLNFSEDPHLPVHLTLPAVSVLGKSSAQAVQHSSALGHSRLQVDGVRTRLQSKSGMRQPTMRHFLVPYLEYDTRMHNPRFCLKRVAVGLSTVWPGDSRGALRCVLRLQIMPN